MLANFETPKLFSGLRNEKLEHGLLVGIALVLASAAMSGEMLEITAGLVGSLCIYLMKERSTRRRTCAKKFVESPACKSKAAVPSKVSGQKFVPRFHRAEPRGQLTFADGLPRSEQVEQLLRDVSPGKADIVVCEEVSRLVSPHIRRIIPEAQIDVVAHSSVVRIGRTGLRPEVDLVVTVPPKVLAQRLLKHMQNNAGDRTVRKLDKIMEMNDKTVNKYAIRVVAAQLSCFKLWRTAYRGAEPKVVLLAPKCIGILSEDMHVHVYVNCPNTIRSMDVFKQSDIQVQKLITFVRRWAQDRCIANAAYGHMPLYAWSLFVKHFCQAQSETQEQKSTIVLFGEFIDFYLEWHSSFSQARGEAAMQIDDPYEAQRNVAESVTSTGMTRFREELERAKRLLTNGSSLLTILEHCNPSPSLGARDVPGSAFGKHHGSDTLACLERTAQSSSGDDLFADTCADIES